MKRLIILCILIVSVAFAQAATMQYYSYPNAKRLRDTGRVLMYDNLSGSRNLTGAQLKSEILNQTTVNAALAANNSPLIKRAGSGDGQYVRQFEIKNASGVIIMWINTLGQMIFGTPLSVAVTSVSPVKGATNISNGVWFNNTTAGLGWQRINPTIPVVDYNKPDNPGWSISPAFTNNSGTPGTVYTITTNLSTYAQQDGETSWGCGTAMNNISNICTSTFQMKP